MSEPSALDPVRPSRREQGGEFAERRRTFAELQVRLDELERRLRLADDAAGAPLEPGPGPIVFAPSVAAAIAPPAGPIVAEPGVAADARIGMGALAAAVAEPSVATMAETEPPARAAPPGDQVVDASGARPRRVSRRVLLAAALCLLLAAVGFGVLRLQQLATASREKIAVLQRSLAAQESPEIAPAPPTASDEPALPQLAAASTTAPEASDSVRQLCTHAEELNRELGPVPELAGAAGPAAQLVARLPQVGDQAAGVLALAAASSDVLAGLQMSCEALDPMLQAQVSGTDASQVVAALGGARDRLRAAAARLRNAESQLATIDERSLDDSTRPVHLALRERLPAVTTRLAFLAELPGLLGHDGPRTYLVLGQNSDELRPTGGFIGTGGLLTFGGGKLVRRQYGSSFAWDVPPDRLVSPPAPLVRYMDAGYWHLKEANWWPDFPSTARQARFFFEQVGEEPIAGVVAIDQRIVELLLEVTGPVALPDYGETVDHLNVRERMEYHTHLRPSQNEQARKGFVSAIFPALLDALDDLPRERTRDLVGALDRALRDQHLQVWAADDRAQQAVADLNWDGRMLATGGDYLFVVNSNLSRNKINEEVEQALGYEVAVQPGGRLVGQATITLRNTRPTSDPGPYRTADLHDYLRVYVPPGSELLAAEGFDEQPAADLECGRTVFGGVVRVRPGDERRVSLTYRLPPSLRQDGYSLLVQKQAGAKPSPLAVRGFGGAEALGDRLYGPNTFAAAGGGLVRTRWSSYGRDVSTRLACEVRTEPPRPLRPPAQIAIPRIGIQASFVDLGVDQDGILEAPKTGEVVGWYRDTARPGQAGNMIASGHVDWNRRAAIFWSLRELRQGDAVRVVTEDGVRYRYEVEWIRSVDPWHADLDELLGPTTDHWLTLITCGGTFNQATSDYSERLIVRARLAGTE